MFWIFVAYFYIKAKNIGKAWSSIDKIITYLHVVSVKMLVVNNPERRDINATTKCDSHACPVFIDNVKWYHSLYDTNIYSFNNKCFKISAAKGFPYTLASYF